MSDDVLIQRFWLRVDKRDDNECWPWLAYLSREGYGRFYIAPIQRSIYAHRFSYELANGPIPEGLHMDHLCRNRGCVNPGHLEAVTPAENARRGDKGRRVTVCVKGHDYTPENTYIKANGCRNCRTCRHDRDRARKVRNRELRKAAA